MAKCILMSIKPKYVSMILNKVKTIEVRKRFPSDYVGWVYIYCTKENDLFKSYIRMGYYTTRSTADDLEYNGKGKVVARFWCDMVEPIAQYDGNEERYFTKSLWETELFEKSCLDLEEMRNYIHNHCGYAIHITKLEIFDKPKEISEFNQLKNEKVFTNLSWLESGKQLRFGNLVSLTRAPQSWCYIEI